MCSDDDVREATSYGVAIQLAKGNDLEHRLGDEVVEWPALEHPGPQVGAGDLEAGHLDMQPVETVGQLDRRPWAIDYDETRQRDHLVIALPGGQPGRGIVADDREQLGAWLALGHPRQRVGSEAGAAPPDLGIAGHQAFYVCDRSLDHRQAVLSGRDR